MLPTPTWERAHNPFSCSMYTGRWRKELKTLNLVQQIVDSLRVWQQKMGFTPQQIKHTRQNCQAPNFTPTTSFIIYNNCSLDIFAAHELKVIMEMLTMDLSCPSLVPCGMTKECARWVCVHTRYLHIRIEIFTSSPTKRSSPWSCGERETVVSDNLQEKVVPYTSNFSSCNEACVPSMHAFLACVPSMHAFLACVPIMRS